MIVDRELGEVRYCHAARRPGRVQGDVTELWDLGRRDVSLLLYPVADAASRRFRGRLLRAGARRRRSAPDNRASRAGSSERRAFVAGCAQAADARRSAVFDELSPTTSCRSTRTPAAFRTRPAGRSRGAHRRTARRATRTLLECCELDREPETGGAAALRVTSVLEEASLRDGGRAGPAWLGGIGRLSVHVTSASGLRDLFAGRTFPPTLERRPGAHWRR